MLNTKCCNILRISLSVIYRLNWFEWYFLSLLDLIRLWRRLDSLIWGLLEILAPNFDQIYFRVKRVVYYVDSIWLFLLPGLELPCLASWKSGPRFWPRIRGKKTATAMTSTSTRHCSCSRTFRSSRPRYVLLFIDRLTIWKLKCLWKFRRWKRRTRRLPAPAETRRKNLWRRWGRCRKRGPPSTWFTRQPVSPDRKSMLGE